MQRHTTTTALALLMIVFAGNAFGQNSTGPGIISGRLMYDSGGIESETCEVRLESIGLEVMGTTWADSEGNFTFSEVRPGNYTIHVIAGGFDEVHQPIDVFGPGPTMALIFLQRSRQKTNASEPAIVDISQFMARYPKEAVKLYEKGTASQQKGKKEEAIREFEKAIRIAPEFYDAHSHLGVLYKDAGRVDEAETEFQRASYLNPSSSDPLVNLGNLYLLENQPEKAVKVSEEAVKANSRSAPAFINLGFALYKISQLDRAEDALKKALSIMPKMFQAHLMLANVYMKLRRYDKLLDQLDDYLGENPNGDQRAAVEKMRQDVMKARAAEPRGQ